MNPTIAAELAEWSTDLVWGKLPSAVQEITRLSLLDTLGLLVLAHDSPPGRAVRTVALRQGGAAESTLAVGGERLPAAAVALVHGTLAHAFDYDATFPTPVFHPGSVVVPVALAVGEAVGADGVAVLTAIALGNEAAVRIASPGGRQFHARGFHSSGIFGPLVAALVAGKLYGLTPRELGHAMGLAGSMSGGLLEFLSDGSWSKRLHPGWAGHGGILAAQLAGEGFPGPPSVLEGRHGIYRAFLGAGTADLCSVTRDLGQDWRSQEIQWKFYPCAHVIHPFLDAALSLRRTHGIAPGDIAVVECHVAPWYVPIVLEPREEKVQPQSEYQARSSLPFALAAALLDGRVDAETFTGAALARTELLSLAARVTYQECPELTPGFDGALHLVARDGRRCSVVIPRQAGLEPRRLWTKFQRNASQVLTADQIGRLNACVVEFEESNPAALLALTRPE